MAAVKTAQERYAELAEQEFERWLESTFTPSALKGVELEELTLPSGMVFTLRRPSPEVYIRRNVNPVFMRDAIKADASKLASASDPKKAADAFFKATPDEQVKMLQMLGDVIRYICVSPRVLKRQPTAKEPDAIYGGDMTAADMNALGEWVGKGGDTAAGLKTFRRKRR